VDYNVAYASVAQGDGTFLAFNWVPLQDNKYEQAGGDKVFFREGTYVAGAAQGYLIDKKTATQYGISRLWRMVFLRLSEANSVRFHQCRFPCELHAGNHEKFPARRELGWREFQSYLANRYDAYQGAFLRTPKSNSSLLSFRPCSKYELRGALSDRQLSGVPQAFLA
jgi:hypothetical protein